jgi:hypothetical protein
MGSSSNAHQPISLLAARTRFFLHSGRGRNNGGDEHRHGNADTGHRIGEPVQHHGDDGVGITAPPTLMAITVPDRFSTTGTVYCMPKNAITLSDWTCSGDNAAIAIMSLYLPSPTKCNSD